jgi:hypothetical protein
MNDSYQDKDDDDDFLHESAVAFAEHTLVPASDCDAVLDTMENCVACVDGAHDQHRYEQHLETRAHGLDADEVAQVRLQAMEDSQHNLSAGAWDLADLNICGTDDFEDAKTTLEQTTSQQQKVVRRAASPTPPSLHCAICYNDVHNFQNTAVTFCHLPCCGSEGREERSTQKVCTACIQLLSSPTSDNSKRIGRCPRCREWIVVKESGLVISTIQQQGQCQVCNQVKGCLVEENVCDACFLGRRRPLFYECEQCHYPQRIPHPMYRYQDSPEKFGSTSWACQGPCQIFTMWRILPDQVRYIPVGDAPEVWNIDTLETARERVMEARRNMHQLGTPKSGGCVIS